MDLYRSNLPWGQLVVLFSDPISCLDILQACVLLQECTLLTTPMTTLPLDWAHYTLKPSLLLPSLRSLSLGLMDRHILLLTALHLPNLRTFCPIGQWDGFQWPSSSLKSFPRLRTLNFCLTTRSMDDDLWEFLYPSRWLTKLYLSQLDPSLFGAALQGLNSGALIPWATSITFHQVSKVEVLFPYWGSD
ncbi:hypothetical protein BD779DRAFT_1002716 [Infundibulicybe gibba]|nr:hypothetical protein BD779DRAFT_1002716 [Infundibulicybe gibba]